MNTKKIVSALVCGTVLLGSSAYALEVDRKVLPRITLGGRLITTLDSDESINIDDSSFAARFDKRMYENGVAGGVLGIRQDEGTVKFNQMHVFFWNRDIETKAGRTRLPNTLIEFPLLRDEDLLSMTHVGNASSNNEFDQLFGKTASFDWVLDQKVQKLGAWFGTRRNDPAISTVDGFDSYGASYRYELPETLRYLKRIRHAGIMLDAQKDSAGSNEFFQSLIAGAEFNLNINPKSNWSMGAQAIFNSGVPGVTQGQLNNANAVSNRARAKSTAFVTSLRYTKRPHLLTRMQAAVTVGYKSYDVGGSEVSIVPNLAYRIGEGVDLLFQYRNTQYRDGLAEIGPTNLFQIGLVFNLDATYNDTIGERDSILNLEHGYIQ